MLAKIYHDAGFKQNKVRLVRTQKILYNIICIQQGTILNTYVNFTLNSIFRPDAFIKKNMHFGINYIVTVPMFFLMKASP